MATSNRPWLDRLKHHLHSPFPMDDSTQAEMPESPTDKTDNTPTAYPFVGFVGESPTHFEADVTWRLAIFRARIPAHGPIWPPRLRDTPLCDTPGQCTLCGDTLSPDRRYRCAECVTALELVTAAVREGAAVTTALTVDHTKPEQGAA